MADIITQDIRPQSPEVTAEDTAATGAERIPTVIADRVDIVYRVNGSGAGRGSATAALNRILRRKQSEKAAGVRKVHAVKCVSFTAYRGEAIGLIGSNGSGKSTLLRAIAVFWAVVISVGGFVYFWKAEERYGRG